MKKTFFVIILLPILLTFFSKDTFAVTVNCGGNIIDTYHYTPIPVDGIKVYIYTREFSEPQDPCYSPIDITMGEGEAVAVTDENGNWLYSCDRWPDDDDWSITRVQFERFNYQTYAWYPPDDACAPPNICFECLTGTIYMAPVGNYGWNCIPSQGLCSYGWLGSYLDMHGPRTCELDTNCSELIRDPITGSSLFCILPDRSRGINTAIGCIPYGNLTDLISFLTKWGMGIGGGIGLALIILSGIIISTSKGNEARLKSGKELLTAAISGLLLIIFSIFLFEFIGQRILKLPGI